VSYLNRCFSFVYPRAVFHGLSLGSASGLIKGKWRVFLLGFLIVWARSQVMIHHLAYLMDLSGTRFFQVSNIDSYLVGYVTCDIILLISWVLVMQGVVIIPIIIFVSYIFFNYFMSFLQTFEDHFHPIIHPRALLWSLSGTILQPKPFLHYHRCFPFCISGLGIPHQLVLEFWFTQSFWVLLKKRFRHFIKHVEDNLYFWRLAQLEFRTNFLEEWEDNVIWKI